MSEKPTALDAVKIQARVVIPIVRALERELGKERAHSIVGRAIAESYAEWQVKTASAQNSHPRDVDIEGQLPIETEVVEDTDFFYSHLISTHRYQSTTASCITPQRISSQTPDSYEAGGYPRRRAAPQPRARTKYYVAASAGRRIAYRQP
jgi:hypothetical protein